LIINVNVFTPKGGVTIDLPAPGDFDSCFVFALHKSGSTLLNNMLAEVLEAAGMPQIALSELLFSAGLPENEIINPQDIVLDRGYCYRGFRQYPQYLNRVNLRDKKKVLLVRDPRDIAISSFFSIAYSHALPESGPVRDEMMARRDNALNINIDEYCISESKYILEEFNGYINHVGPDTRVYRYEDVIFKKEAWLHDLVKYYEIPVSDDLIALVAKKHDLIPNEERAGHHIRQVVPGNHKKHLSPEAIARLGTIFASLLAQFRYETAP